ncbi:dipeptide ABC transporter ATP-binding protein [Georgenia subflava]|uniref:Dipeptide ABC transporter ATP-binding protein n=1 Tax=Georgenia subflava TaxID=1622177 RepID=A0A6N7EBB7_9MICO|nr:ABC transporter ATP-binding protein [Georgenia subflava]MPV35682.1 dipeptide ABC transporter ATP-binding protein [Georgenia subflava]
MTALLKVSDLHVRYGGLAALDGVDLRVDAGRLVSVAGESGSGKSSLVSAVLGLLPAGARSSAATVELGGRSVASLGRREMARLRGSLVGYIPQDPGASLNPVKRVGTQVADAIRVHRRLPRRTVDALVLAGLADAGLSDVERIARAYPHELSGGMKQRVLIAIALANDPALLIADEPTSALDVTVQRTILDHLQRLRSERGLGVLLVTHDLGVAAERSDHIYVMRRGRVVEAGPVAAVTGAPAESYTRRLLQSSPTLRSPRLRPARPATAHTGEPVVVVRGAGRTFPARTGGTDVTALSGVDLVLRRGTTHAVVGESGAGKSTLARVVVGLERPDAGSVHVLGREMAERSTASWRAARRHIQLVHQNPYSSLDPRMRIADIVSEPLRHLGQVRDRRAGRGRAEELLQAVHLDPAYLGRRPAELSGGERQRVAIARALALRPEIIVLDEAVSALDVVVQASILQLLADLQGEHGTSYLFITHDLGVVAQIADDVTVLRAGSVVESGRSEQVLDAPNEPYTRQFIDATPRAVAAHKEKEQV